jgi:branched-chain amino acid aminotransferase
LIVLAEHKAPVYGRRRLSLVTSSVRRFPPDCLDPKIHHNNLIQSILAKIEANVAGADDALMLDQRVHRRDQRDATCSSSSGACAHAAPRGLSRGHHARAGARPVPLHGIAHEETDLTLTEAYRADEMFCTGTMGELAAGHSGGRPQDRLGEPGP